MGYLQYVDHSTKARMMQYYLAGHDPITGGTARCIEKFISSLILYQPEVFKIEAVRKLIDNGVFAQFGIDGEDVANDDIERIISCLKTSSGLLMNYAFSGKRYSFYRAGDAVGKSESTGWPPSLLECYAEFLRAIQKYDWKFLENTRVPLKIIPRRKTGIVQDLDGNWVLIKDKHAIRTFTVGHVNPEKPLLFIDTQNCEIVYVDGEFFTKPPVLSRHGSSVFEKDRRIHIVGNHKFRHEVYQGLIVSLDPDFIVMKHRGETRRIPFRF